MTLAEAFRMTYDVRPSGVWSAPGRVNLIGEHTDYNDGFVLPFAIAARTSVAAAPRDDDLLRMRSLQQPSGDASVTLDALEPGRPEGWASYVAGVVWAVREQGHEVRGADLVVDGRVPLGGGLSSSHALEVAVAIAVNDLFGLGLDTDALADLTRLAENKFVGAPTGLMDQLALLRGQAGHALFLDTRSLHAEQVPLDPAADGYALVVIDTKVHHSLGDGAYADRRAACERAAAQLGLGSLRDLALDGLAQRLAGLDDELCRRARHVVTENARVPAAVDALRSRDWAELGSLMNASHTSLRDDYEVSCDELDVAVEAARRAGAVAARMTGGGFGGSAIALAPARRMPALRSEVVSAFAAAGWPTPGVFEVAPSDGARRDH
ncbi:MAG: galactokinase [Sporichthyaceae bacterium]|nr:galactokinase [Sporichthyaceae bacterium]